MMTYIHSLNSDTSSVAPTLPTLLKDLSVVESKWKSLGVALGLSKDELDGIQMEKQDNSLGLILKSWLSDNTKNVHVSITWESLARALDSIKEPALAETLRRQHTGR